MCKIRIKKANHTPVTRTGICELKQHIIFLAVAMASAIPCAYALSGDKQTVISAMPAVSFVAEAAHTVMFVDSRLENIDTSLLQITPGTQLVYLDPHEDGLLQMARALSSRTDVQTIHVLSHGDTGKIQLGNAWLDSEAINARSDILADIGRALSPDGDILLYACRTGAGQSGAALITELARLTQADVAASTDNTGAQRLGGNWVLEAQAGVIETSSLAVSEFDALLAAPTTLDFDSVAVDGGGRSLGGSPRVFDGWTVSLVDSGGNNAPDTGGTPSYLDVSKNSADTSLANDGSDKALKVEGYFGVVKEARFTATSNEEFWLQSFHLENVLMGNAVRVVGYRDGVQVASQDFTAVQSADTTVTIDHGADQDWQNIDQFRIVQQNASADLFFYIDDIVVSAAVLPNTAPSIGNLNGDSVAWAGAGNTVVLDAGGNAALSDTELGALNSGNGNWSGASLTVQRPGTAVSADTYGFDTSGALFTVNGSDLQDGGQTFATFTNTNGLLTVSFTSSGTAATTALVSDVAQRITYRSDTPAGDATLRYTLSDGTSSTTADVTVTSDTIYVTNTTDTATINVSNGVSFSEAVAIAAADGTGSQTLILSNSFNSTMTLAGALAINESLTINGDSAHGLTFSGSTITLGGGTTLNFTNSTGTVTIASALAGTGSLVKAGAGTLALSSTSNESGMSGGISVTAGTLSIGSDDHLSSGTLTLDGGTLNNSLTSFTVDNAIVLGASGGTFAVAGGGGATTLTLSGIISGSGSLTKTTAAILQLDGNNTYTGATNVSAGTLIANHNNALGTTAGATTASANATVRVAGGLTIGEAFTISGTGKTVSGVDYGALHLTSGTSSLSGAITLAADANVSAASGSTFTLSGALDGAFNLNKTDEGTLTLSNAGNSTTLSGGISVTAGTLSVASDNHLSSGGLTLDSGSTLAVTGATTIDNSIALTGAATVSASANATLSGIISGASNLTKEGASTLTLSGSNTYSGATTVNAGTLAVSSDSNLGSDALILASGTTLAVTGATNIDNAIALAGNATVSNSTTVTLSGVISGANNLSKAGAAALTLSGSNTYSGTTTISAGTLSVGSDSNLGSGVLTLANGSTLAVTGATTIDNAIALSGGTASVNTSANTTLSGNITGAGGLTKTGASTLTLSGTDSYTGTTSVNAGSLLVNGALSATSGTTVASGATLGGSGSISSNLTVNTGGTLSPGNSAGTLTVNGDLTMAAGSTLAVEINGTTAGTQYDQVIVNGAVDVSGATLSTTHGYSPGSGDTYTIIVNDAADAVTGSFSGLAEGAAVTAGGNGTVLTASYIGGTGNNFTLTAPSNPTVISVSSTSADGTYKIGDTVTVVVNFSEAVFLSTEAIQLTLETGTTDRVLSYLAGSGSSSLSFNYTVQEGDTAADLDYTNTTALVANGDTIQSGSFIDAILTLPTPGAAGSLANSADLVVDGVRPTASIVVADTALAAGETSTVTITFSEAVTGLAIGDFTVANGALSSLSSGDGGITWTATLTPTASVADTTNLITLDNTGVADAAGNTGTGTTDSNNYAIDSVRPTAGIVVADTALAAGETSTVTITFNEAVSGLATADFAVSNGALSGLSSGDGGITWTATLTPTASVEDTTNLIVLNNTGVQDAAGNAGTGTTDSNNYAIDTLRPTATLVVTDTALIAGETSQVTFTFSEVVAGFANDDLTLANGSLSAVSSSDGGITWMATFTPDPEISDAANIITLDNTGVSDTAGNVGTGTTDSNNYAVDTLRPSATIVLADTELTMGETSLVTVTFNRAVTGFDNADLAADNGTLTLVSSSDGGITWTATFTPDPDIDEPNNFITLDNTGVTDGANNSGTGSSISSSFVIRTVPMTLLVTSSLDTGDDETNAATLADDQADGNGLSLREALYWIRSGDTITFDLDAVTAGNQGDTITLNGNSLTIAYNNISIDGDLNDDGIADVTISANNASRVMSVNASLSGIELSGLTLTQGNSTGGGGGLALGTSANITLRASNITNNTISGIGGGGIYGNSVTLTVINSTVSGNTSDTFGGGIRAVGASVLNVVNSTVSGNTTTGASQHGGGIQYAGSTLTIINSTISGNAASGANADGGGLRITSGTSYIYNTTMVGNAASGNGGGVSANGSSDSFLNTVVAGNTAGAGATAAVGGSSLATGGADNDASGNIEVATNSYFGTTATITTDNNSLNNQGTANLLLADLADNGGNGLTHRPQTGSALVDAGSTAALPADTYDLDGDTNVAEALPVDALGASRVSGAAVDIGAVEGNRAPELFDLDGGNSYIEGDVAVVIDNNVTVTDNELDELNGGNGNYSGATVTILRSGGVNTTDTFSFMDGSGMSLVAGEVIKNGQAIATFDTATAGQLVVTYTDANGERPERSDVNAMMQQITYASTSNDPDTSVVLDWTFADEVGAPITETASVTISLKNDAPTLTATAGSPTFTENGTAVDLFSGVTVSTVEAAQTIIALQITVTNANNGSSEILTIDGSDVELTQGNSLTTVTNALDVSVALVDTTATVTLSNATGISPAAAQTVVDGITYRNTDENPNPLSRVVTLTRIQDNGGTANDGVDTTTFAVAATVTITAVNNAPIISGTPATTVDQNALYGFTPTAADVDSDTLTFSIVNQPAWASFDTATGTLSGVPSQANVGIFSNIVISVSDGDQVASLPAFSLLVADVNDAPTISGTPGTTVAQDAAYSFTPTANDIDTGDTLTFSISNKPVWASFNSATGALTGTPGNDAVGTTAAIVISVSDGSLTAALPAFSLSVINVNDAPTISGTPGTSVAQDAAYSFTPTANDIDTGDTLTFSISKKPVWASFNSATGALTGTPGNDAVGPTAAIVISVSDGSLTAALPAFSLSVTNVNDAPTISGTPGTTVAQDTAYSFTPTANDIDTGATLTFSISNKPVWASFNSATGALTGTPGNDAVGTTAAIVISVSDGSLTAALPAFSLSVTNVNDAPTISGTPSTSVAQDAAYSFTPTANDIDTGDTLTFSISNKPVWASFDTTTGALTGTPLNEHVGTTTGVVITVSDGEYNAALPAFNLTVVNVNETPVISGTPATSVNQDIAYSFVPTTSDPDDDTLTFSITNKPTWASFDTATGALTGTPAKEHVGTTTGVVISVSDGEYNAALPAFNLTVVNVNETPVITGTPETSVNEDEAYSFVPTASDPDDDTLTFSIANKPSWASFDTATGALTGTPAKEHVGTTTGIVIRVSDGEFTANLAAFNLEVINVNAAPAAVDDNVTLPFSENHTYLLDVLANDTDPDQDELSITAADASIGLVSIQSNKLLFNAPENFSGTATFSYNITDGELTAKANVTLLITGNNPDAPVITAPDDLFINATGLFTKVDVGVATAVDAAGNRLAVSLVNGLPLFASGRHELYWQATDAAGISSTVTQLLQIQPLLSLSKPQTVINHSNVSVDVILNGPAPVYPVEVAYTVSGSANAMTEHDLVAGTVQISSGLRTSISFNVFANLNTQVEKDIVITLDSSHNLGANASTTVSVTEANLTPVVLLDAQQQGESRSTVGKTAGLVTIMAQVTDPNPGDITSLQWQADAALSNISADTTQFIFDPASLNAGVYRIALSATDNAAEPLSRTSEIYLLVLDVLPVLDNSDSNNNLIPDNIEGLADSNSNGIPDYLDPGFDCNVMPEQLASVSQFVAEGEPGICLRKGAAAALSGNGGIQLSSADLQWLEPDMQATNIGGTFDFILRNLPAAGASYHMVLPQRQPVPQNAVYRKLTQATGWSNFVLNERNQLFSAAGEPGFCPPPGDSDWQTGLTAGHWCVQLQLEDGGPNDADGLANGTIVDPGGVAVVLNGNQLPVAVDDSYPVQWNQSHSLDVLQNDTDPDGDTLSINQATAAFGSVSISDDGQTLWYIPPQDFVGTDTLSYGLSDDNGGSASASVAITVYYNRAPEVTNSTASTDDRTVIILDVLAGASDADADTLTIDSASALQGSVTITAEHNLRYVPRTGFSGTDVVSFSISDNRGGITQGEVTITVTAYEVITVKNKSSGGAYGLWSLLLLSGLIALRRQRIGILASAVLAVLSFSSQANWTADAQLGKNSARQSHSDVTAQLPTNATLVDLDNSSGSWALGASYALSEKLALQLHYVDLGSTSLTIQGDTLTPAQFHQAVSDIGPLSAEGVRSGISYRIWQRDSWQLALQTGVFVWHSEQRSQAGNTVIRNKMSDTDIYWAFSTGYQLSEQLVIQANFNRYHLEGNKTDNLMLGLSYQF